MYPRQRLMSKRVAQVPPSGIRRFFDIAATMDDVISLSIGEPDFTTPGPLIEAGVESLRRGRTHYTSNAGILELRQALGAHLARLYGLSYDPRTELLITVGVSEGLYLAMTAMLDPGDEVIVPAFSFFATVGCVIRQSAVPVFADIDPVTFNVTPQAVAEAVTPRTRAVIVVHLFGQCADMDPILETARRHDLVVIEDAAQSLGARYKGRPAGSLGDLGCFSFFPSKNLGACGDAGMIVTNDEELALRCRLIRQHGASPKYHHSLLGGNFRLDALQAAVLNAKMPHLAAWNEARARNASHYDDLLAGTGVQRPAVAPYNQSVFHQYVVRVANRDEVRARMQDRGVATEVYYPEPLNNQPCVGSLGRDAGGCPEAGAASRQVLALPVYPELTRDMRTYVADCLIEATGGQGQAAAGAASSSSLTVELSDR